MTVAIDMILRGFEDLVVQSKQNIIELSVTLHYKVDYLKYFKTIFEYFSTSFLANIIADWVFEVTASNYI